METHQKFIKKYDLSYALIVDDGRLKKLYSKNRTTYIIDNQGIIRFIQKGVPDNSELLTELKKLK